MRAWIDGEGAAAGSGADRGARARPAGGPLGGRGPCRARAWALLIAALAISLLAAGTATAADPAPGSVQSGRIRAQAPRLYARDDGRTELAADLAITLPADAVEALRHGVPLTFRWQCEIVERDGLRWNRRLWDTEGRVRLDYRSLSRRYSLVDPAVGRQQSFPDLGQALAAMGTLRQLLPPLAAVLAQAREPALRFRMYLEIGALPPALRLPGYLDPAWRIDSGWTVALPPFR